MSFTRVTIVVWILAALVWAAVGVQKASATPPGGPHIPVEICHKPGTPAEQTLVVDDDAVPAHLAHGDYLGPCGPVEYPEECPEDTHYEQGECVPDEEEPPPPPPDGEPPIKGKPPFTKCTEDMACWDCKTMGNLKCGPGGIDRNPVTPKGELPYTGPWRNAIMWATLGALLIGSGLLLRRWGRNDA